MTGDFGNGALKIKIRHIINVILISAETKEAVIGLPNILASSALAPPWIDSAEPARKANIKKIKYCINYFRKPFE